MNTLYPYEAHFELGVVALNVADLNKQKLFYEQVLGLTVLEDSSDKVVLGVADRPLVELIQVSDLTPISASYGLYHLAILLPDRTSLGTLFRHFLKHQVPLIGASNHGYSEAIYLEDTEGNGIEVYRDRAFEKWDVREDGQILGVTEEMDAQAVYDAGTDTAGPYRIPVGTTMGHVHLSVRHSQESSSAYQTVLGMTAKFAMPTGAWLSSGRYHHHLAVNEWAGQKLSDRKPGQLGLVYFTLKVSNPMVYKGILKQAEDQGWQIELGLGQAELTDSNGIVTRVRLD
ncbi:VOC family protein [Streptococcus moroccensis]|uniref:Catechol 2,3-dioxygenase n=1 Tax=Streptococcus moroccensis TaxID=1451356 RepID=A0ABT9YS32_9STRE|nr:VOC family protein [Streptococcus moroccensis]MDQ0221915.1 catechol 2,3-dioxygenase [Streptococcus moroccensis]